MGLARRLRRPTSIALLALVAIAAPVEAHAWLLSSEPAANSHVQEAPPSVVLRFTENVEREYTGATVEDLNGTRVDDGRIFYHTGGNQNEIAVALQDDLGDAVYVVKWQTLSVDTHTAHGQFVFAVGNASLEGVSAVGAAHEHGPKQASFWFEAAARSVFYAGIAATIGLPVYLLVVWPAARAVSKLAPEEETRPTRRATRLALIFAGLGAAAGLVVLWAFSQRIELGIPAAASSTRTGQYLAARIGALTVGVAVLALAASRSQAGRERWFWGVAVLAGVGAALLTSLSSHAASVADKGVAPVLADFVHILGGSVWIGGLLAFAAVLPDPNQRGAGHLVRRFSPLAMVAVLAILVSGIYASLLHVRSFDELFGTLYGRAILAKVGLLVVLLGFGAWNQFILGPRLRGGRGTPVSLDKSVTAEACLLAIVLLAAGLLSTTAPPAAGADDVPEGVERFERGFDTFHLVVDITPSPIRVGFQNITVALHPMTDEGISPDTEVFFKFQAPGTQEPDDITAAEKKSPDTWFLRGSFFTERGNWTLHVIVQGPEYAKSSFPVNVR